MDEFLALTWEDDDGPHVVTGELQFIETSEEEPAEFARYSYVPAPPIMVRPPMMRHTYVIDGKNYEFSWLQEHTIHLKKKEEKMAEYTYTDEDGDRLELEDDNTIHVYSMEDGEEASVYVRKENLGPFIYHLLENDGAATTLAPEAKDADADVCRNMILSYAKRLMDIQEEEDEEEDGLTDLAITLYSTFYGCTEDSARKVFHNSEDSRKKAIGWARKLKERETKKVLEYEDRHNPDESVTWKANNDSGYFSFRLGKWYYSPEGLDAFRPYGTENFSYLNHSYFPMTAV